MQEVRLTAVLMRVVAWHNRHPLARRITATQVHSIGEVVLPFASARTMAAPAAASGLPDVAELLDPSPGQDALALPTGATPGMFAAQLAAHRAAVAARQARPVEPSADAVPLQDGAEAAAATAAPDPPSAADAGPAPEPRTDAGVDRFAQAAAAPAVPTLAAAQGQAATASRLPAWLARALARLGARQPGLSRLRPVFSRNFIWPMGPRQVAAWARRHGSLQPVAPADWPRRVVETDTRLLAAARTKGLAGSASLHLLTAAIGVDDRRIRLLMDAQGAILGTRAYSRGRLAIAGGLTAAALLAVGWDRLLPLWQTPAPGPALAQAAASTAQAAASDTAALDPALALAAAASATAHEAAASAAAAAEPAQADKPAPLLAARTSTETSTEPPPQTPPQSPAQTPAHRPAASAAPPETSHGTDRRGQTKPVGAQAAAAPAAIATDGAPLGRIRPQLSAEDRAAARQQSAALRGKPTPAAPTAAQAQPDATAPAQTIYAVVTRPASQRQTAASSLALMRGAEARLPPPLPSHGELMQHQGSWRAAWWPFASLADAERARVLLVGKGVKAEVVEF